VQLLETWNRSFLNITIITRFPILLKAAFKIKTTAFNQSEKFYQYLKLP